MMLFVPSVARSFDRLLAFAPVSRPPAHVRRCRARTRSRTHTQALAAEWLTERPHRTMGTRVSSHAAAAAAGAGAGAAALRRLPLPFYAALAGASRVQSAPSHRYRAPQRTIARPLQLSGALGVHIRRPNDAQAAAQQQKQQQRQQRHWRRNRKLAANLCTYIARALGLASKQGERRDEFACSLSSYFTSPFKRPLGGCFRPVRSLAGAKLAPRNPMSARRAPIVWDYHV